MCTIRRATLADANSISELAAAVFPLGCTPNTDPRDIAAHVARELTPEKFRAYIADPAATVLVAHVGNALAGYAIFIRGSAHPLLSQAEAQSAVEVGKFYVDPRFHGHGIAQELMRCQLELHAGAGVVWLSANAYNERAKIFYGKFGFEVIGTQQYRVGNDLQDDLVMRRKQETVRSK
jgi:diamine N-acetyltransferase